MGMSGSASGTSDSENLFGKEDGPSTKQVDKETWKVMVIDDDESVHQISDLVLRNFTFMEKGLEVIHGYSGEEACDLINKHPDTAAMLLDVVMENDKAGLEVVKYVREQLNNHCLQIVLRTGQAGSSTEEQVVRNHEINGYSDKSDLTANKFNSLLVTSLRAFRDITTIISASNLASSENKKNEETKQRLHKIVTEIKDKINECIEDDSSIDEFKRRVLKVIDESETIIYIKDISGRYLLINRRFENLFRITFNEIISRNDHDVFGPILADQLWECDKQAILNRSEIKISEFFSIGNKQQQHFTYKIPLYDADSEVFAICSISSFLCESASVYRLSSGAIQTIDGLAR